MKSKSRRCLPLVLFMLASMGSSLGWTTGPMAFSLGEAERRLRSGGASGDAVSSLGGIGCVGGFVVDPTSRDLILVGQVGVGEDRIRLEDVVLAMRSVILRDELPEVSIDTTPDTAASKMQKVRFVGGLEDTRMGRDLLAADLVLKKLGLGVLPTEIWNVKPYLAARLERSRNTPAAYDMRTKFWFYPCKRQKCSRSGVFVLRDFQVGIEARLEAYETGSEAPPNGGVARNEVADEFAAALTAALPDITAAHPEVGRVYPWLRLVGLAVGMKELSEHADLGYWLTEYPVPAVPTAREVPVLTRRESLRAMDGRDYELSLNGGVQLRVLLDRLSEDGDAEALRDIVLRFRPLGSPLVWPLPLGAWSFPGCQEPVPSAETRISPEEALPDTWAGFTMTEALRPANELPRASSMKPLVSAPIRLPSFDLRDSLPTARSYGDVGGVLLRGAAKMPGDVDAAGALTAGNFSLIVSGENASVAPVTFHRFITALWAVYYGKEDPGISIDPIAPGVEKHLVRYVGKVINTDLGRVMREADYTMKKWAVGTEKPDVRGFKDVDDLMAKHGFRYVGASRRFWFVPEDMKFKRGGDMLLFDSGRMTIKTEYVLQNKGVKAEPADEAFAGFFTSKYDEIAARYPVYRELFDYAKLVSLAKYLKDNGVPLFWFLMANKDLVLTEDSPGTVDALAKGSKNFEGLTIEGGVELASQGQYVYDGQAVAAIAKAVSMLPTSSSATRMATGQAATSAVPSEPFSFSLKDRSYSVLPQHSLTSGRDRRGIRYQTDLALRQEGQPGLELVRYFRPGDTSSGEFGQGWHLLIPYRVAPAGDTKREFLNAMIPERMKIVNLLSGQEEVLSFSTDRYSIAGYVPDKLESSQVVGLFIMTDASFRLADKLGNEFWFEGDGLLTDMILSDDNRIHVEYQRSLTEAFAQPPYKLEPDGEDRVDFANVSIPKRMQVKDLTHGGSEPFVFGDLSGAAGYVPENTDTSRFKILALVSDGSFRLLDKKGNEAAFDPSGEFAGMGIQKDGRPLVASLSEGTRKVTFEYTVDRDGDVVIARAVLQGDAPGKSTAYVVTYHYDEEGRLFKAEGAPTQAETLAARR